MIMDDIIQRNPDLLDCMVDQEVVLMSAEKGRYMNLNKQGSAIWSLIETPSTVRDIVEGLLRRFEVSREVCEREVVAFLEKLRMDGLIRIQ